MIRYKKCPLCQGTGQIKRKWIDKIVVLMISAFLLYFGTLTILSFIGGDLP